MDPGKEFRKRILATMPILKRLDTFWNTAKCNEKRKIEVLNEAILSKLGYCLKTTESTEGANETLDAFHLKGLRQILKMKTTYIDRPNTNQRVYAKTHQVLKTETIEGPRTKNGPYDDTS